MAANRSAVRVEGFAGLRRAWIAADRFESRELINSLKDAAEPVRSTAEAEITTDIGVGRIPWNRLRVGVLQKSVYVAPVARNTTGRKRPNLALKLLEPMLDSLGEHRSDVIREVDSLLGRVGRVWETTP